MPYITREQREALDALNQAEPNSAGQLNYLITMLCKGYWDTFPGYRTIAEITGVLENVKQEFYRRVASSYEDEKIKANGDVY